MTRRILAVTARWHADQPEGFAVAVYFETPELGEHFAKQLAAALEGLDRRADWSPELAAAHLRDVARVPEGERGETIRRRAVGIVAWLQDRGHLTVGADDGIEWHRAAPVLDEPTVVALVPPAPPAPPSSSALRKKPRAASKRAAGPRESVRPAKKKSSKKTARKKP